MTAATKAALTLHPGPEGWETNGPAGSHGLADNRRTSESAFLQLMRTSLLTDDWPYAIRAFRTLMQLPLPAGPTTLTPMEKLLHASLLTEEVSEFAAATGVIEQADGLLDIIYVALGALLHLGLTPNQIQAGFNEVHCSNMTKVMDNGRPLINDGAIDSTQPIGKVLKTSNYVRPDLAAAFLLPQDEPTCQP